MDDDDNGQLLDSDLGYNMRSPKDTRKIKHPTHALPPPLSLSPLEPIQDEPEDEQSPGNVFTTNTNKSSRPSATQDESHHGDDDQDNQEQMQMMSRYWRSKSLPAAYFPQFPLTSASVDASECSCGNSHPPEEDYQHHYRRADSSKSSSSSKSKSGKGNKSGSRGNSCRSRGCSGASGGGSNCHSVASGSSSTGDPGNSDASGNGCNHHHIHPEPIRCVKKGGGNSGHSGEQVKVLTISVFLLY